MISQTSVELLSFFKTLVDDKRLKIVGLLAHGPSPVEPLAVQLKRKPSAVTRDLVELMEAGLVIVVSTGPMTRYALRLDGLHTLAAQLLARGDSFLAVEALGLDDYERKVMKDFLRADGSLKEIPMQPKKLMVVLRYILNDFELDRHYTEKQVNEIMARFHPDTATLRRAMIDCGLMKRPGGLYSRLA